jgi:hypothetical protein
MGNKYVCFFINQHLFSIAASLCHSLVPHTIFERVQSPAAVICHSPAAHSLIHCIRAADGAGTEKKIHIIHIM